MRHKKTELYPAVAEVESIKNEEAKKAKRRKNIDEAPDMIQVSTPEGLKFCPNYSKFGNVAPEAILAWLNID